MGKPKEIWYSYAKNMVKVYRKRAVEYNALCTLTGDHAATLPGSYQKEYDSVTQAIEIMRNRRNGGDKLALVNMALIAGNRSLEDAADELYISYATARRYQREFIYLVAECYGLKEGGEQQKKPPQGRLS